MGRHRSIVWLWKCDCGKDVEAVASDIKRGHKKSCGCLQPESARERTSKPKGQAAFNTLLFSYKQNARLRGFEFFLTDDEFANLTKQPCFYCGKPPSQIFHRTNMNGSYTYSGVDRINNSIGYTTDNCVPCCGKCNHMKGTFDYEEFMLTVIEIYKHNVMGEKNDRWQ